MRHFYIRKAVILAVRTAGLGMLVPALLALGGIAESLGYQDVSFFCRQFKNRTGYSPGQFRRQSRPDSRLPDSRS